jgi:hypothetical protein
MEENLLWLPGSISGLGQELALSVLIVRRLGKVKKK